MVSAAVQPLLLAMSLLAARAQAEHARQAFGALFGQRGLAEKPISLAGMTLRDPLTCWQGFKLSYRSATKFEAESWEACRNMCRDKVQQKQQCDFFSFDGSKATPKPENCHLVSMQIASREPAKQTNDHYSVSGHWMCKELLDPTCRKDATDSQCIAGLQLQIGSPSRASAFHVMGLQMLTKARPELLGALGGCEKGIAGFFSYDGTTHGVPMSWDARLLIALFMQLRVVKESLLFQEVSREVVLIQALIYSRLANETSSKDNASETLGTDSNDKASSGDEQDSLDEKNSSDSLDPGSPAQVRHLGDKGYVWGHEVDHTRALFIASAEAAAKDEALTVEKWRADGKEGKWPLLLCDTRGATGGDDGRIVSIGSKYAFTQDRDFKLQQADVHVDTVAMQVKLSPLGFFGQPSVAFPIEGGQGKANVFKIVTDKFPKGLKPIVPDHVALIRKLPSNAA